MTEHAKFMGGAPTREDGERELSARSTPPTRSSREVPLKPLALEAAGKPACSQPRGRTKKRPAMNDRLRMAALRKADTRVLCTGCNTFVPLWHVQFDHELALIDGGAHDEENVRAFCKACHARKSAREHINNCKTKRVAAEENLHRAVMAGEAERQAGKIKGRGFQQHPTLKRQVGGKVVARA